MLLLIQRFVSAVVLVGILAGCFLLFGRSSGRQSTVNSPQALAQATAIIIDANGNYIVDAAMGTAIVADSNWGIVNIYQAGQKQGFGAGIGVVFMGFMALIICLLVGALIGVARRRR